MTLLHNSLCILEVRLQNHIFPGSFGSMGLTRQHLQYYTSTSRYTLRGLGDYSSLADTHGNTILCISMYGKSVCVSMYILCHTRLWWKSIHQVVSKYFATFLLTKTIIQRYFGRPCWTGSTRQETFMFLLNQFCIHTPVVGTVVRQHLWM